MLISSRLLINSEVFDVNKEFILSNDSQVFNKSQTECPVCGKKFYIESINRKVYVYKTKNRDGKVRYACSHTCYKELKETIEKARFYRKW